MEDLGNYKIIVYIVLAILYFLFTGKKKPVQKKTPPVVPKERREENPSVHKSKPKITQPRPIRSEPATENPAPYSLEDILKQFGQAPEKPAYKEVKEARKKESFEKPETKIVDYDDDLEDGVEKFNKNSGSRMVSKEDLLNEEHLVPYVAATKSENKYAEMLKDPEGAKMAFIAGEIFNRKF